MKGNSLRVQRQRALLSYRQVGQQASLWGTRGTWHEWKGRFSLHLDDDASCWVHTLTLQPCAKDHTKTLLATGNFQILTARSNISQKNTANARVMCFLTAVKLVRRQLWNALQLQRPRWWWEVEPCSLLRRSPMCWREGAHRLQSGN